MGSAQKSPDPTSGVYIVKNTMVEMEIKIASFWIKTCTNVRAIYTPIDFLNSGLNILPNMKWCCISVVTSSRWIRQDKNHQILITWFSSIPSILSSSGGQELMGTQDSSILIRPLKIEFRFGLNSLKWGLALITTYNFYKSIKVTFSWDKGLKILGHPVLHE